MMFSNKFCHKFIRFTLRVCLSNYSVISIYIYIYIYIKSKIRKLMNDSLYFARIITCQTTRENSKIFLAFII